jgi:hypothetical protein
MLLQAKAVQTLEPNFPTIGAADEEMVETLHLLGAQGTRTMVVKSMPLQAFRSPHPLMHKQPNKHFALIIRRMGLP